MRKLAGVRHRGAFGGAKHGGALRYGIPCQIQQPGFGAGQEL